MRVFTWKVVITDGILSAAETEAFTSCCLCVVFVLQCSSFVWREEDSDRRVKRDECVWFLRRHKETVASVNSVPSACPREPHAARTHTHTHTLIQIEPQMSHTCYSHTHIADISEHMHRLFHPPGHRAGLMTALGAPFPS